MKKLSLMKAGAGIVLATLLFLGSGSFAAAQTATSTDVSTTTATSTDSGAGTTTPSVATTTPVSIMVMKHLCSNTIQNEDNLTNGQSMNSLQGFVNAHVACPNTALPGDEAASSTISAPRRDFSFLLNFNPSAGSGQVSKNLSDADYEQRQLCGNEILAIDNSITGIASTTCLDVSRYNWSNVSATGTMTITENDPPAGYHFGAVMFTPTALMANNDAQTLVSTASSSDGTGSIVLNPELDNATGTEKMIMLHVFNFQDTSTSTGTTTPPTATTTPPTGTTTPPVGTTTPPSGISDEGWRTIMNAIQRIEDIQSRLIDLLFSLTQR